MKDINERAIQLAQAQLMQRASLLILMGYEAKVYADYFYIGGKVHSFYFWFKDIELTFGKETPYDADLVDAAIVRLDGMIEEAYKKAENTIQIVKAWRG